MRARELRGGAGWRLGGGVKTRIFPCGLNAAFRSLQDFRAAASRMLGGTVPDNLTNAKSHLNCGYLFLWG